MKQKLEIVQVTGLFLVVVVDVAAVVDFDVPNRF